MNKEKFYLSTAIVYTSGRPHIGNVYEIVLADAICRYKRERGYDVYFQTGTDEHGQKIEDKAKAAGMSPQAYVDQVKQQVEEEFHSMNVSYDKFVRTTDPYHVKQVQKIFKKLYEKGDIYKSEYNGLYCKACEAFYAPSQIIDGKCPECHGELIEAKEDAYFFKMASYQECLMKHIEEHPEFIQPESRKNEMINNFLKPGLKDLCVSRSSIKWGIPVDFDPGHVVYVWIDALSNYITGIGYDANGHHHEDYLKYWPADIHLIGKDILRFHTIYWPIILMALNEPLPKQVFGHPWLLVGDSKMSKSKGNVIYASELVKLFSTDAVRYIMLHEMPFGNDGTITHELMIERINSDLANVLGNLVNRTVAMSNKYFEGVISQTGCQESVDADLKEKAQEMIQTVEKYMATYHVADALDAIFTFVRRCNKYIDETMPWSLAKDETQFERLHEVLYNLLESVRMIGIMLRSFIPETSDKILKILQTQQTSYESCLVFGQLENGNRVVETPDILFNRYDEKEVLEKLVPKQERDDYITIQDFEKINLIVGEVLSVEEHRHASKLFVLQVNIGKEVRQIVSGIKEHYTKEELIHKKVIVVENLKPVEIRQVKSEGMLLAGSFKKGLEVVQIDTLPVGTKIK